MPRSLVRVQHRDPQVTCGNKNAVREPDEMFFATDCHGDIVAFCGGLSLLLDQEGDVVGEIDDESEIQLFSQLLSRVGRS